VEKEVAVKKGVRIFQVKELLDVIARLDRAIQYSRSSSAPQRSLWNTGCPLKAGYDSGASVIQHSATRIVPEAPCPGAKDRLQQTMLSWQLTPQTRFSRDIRHSLRKGK
jgi:hypothetical protein